MLKDLFDTVNDLQEQLVRGNTELIGLLNKLTPEQQKEYGPKVIAMIDNSKKLVTDIKLAIHS